ncbi:hypothetical protein B0T16DRAFT_389216 [Cercophora newfieldiana]|uniref:Uncharacterized protein n=1 Tax=Cercophora newfieldiana TaxID=92897 RepID=A0AA40CRV1_9PEZI|nr:hypothetical protein B0T16DRAFT_389216 [Cercophora newfieldiana]
MAGSRASSRILALHAGTAILWVLLLVFCRRNLFDVPSSYFFNPRSGPGLRVSDARKAEINRHLEEISFPDEHSDGEGKEIQRFGPRRWPKRLCLGIVSDPKKANHDEISLARTLASLKRELTSNDRESMHVAILLATKSPTDHFAFGTTWLPKLVDEILVYGEVNQENTTIPGIPGRQKYNQVDPGMAHGVPAWGAPSISNARLEQLVILDMCYRTQASVGLLATFSRYWQVSGFLDGAFIGGG